MNLSNINYSEGNAVKLGQNNTFNVENNESKGSENTETSSLKKIDRYTKIDFPCECILEQEVELKIQLIFKLPPPQENTTAQLISIPVDDETKELKLHIHITSQNFRIQQPSKSLLLHFNRDSEEIIFVLVPVVLGEQIMEIEFFHQASRVGYVIVKTNVKNKERTTEEVNT